MNNTMKGVSGHNGGLRQIGLKSAERQVDGMCVYMTAMIWPMRGAVPTTAISRARCPISF